LDHLNRVRELFLIPDEILVLFRVLNIKPEDIDRNICLVEAALHRPDIIRTDVVPPALMVSERPMRRDDGGARQTRVLSEHVRRGGARQQEDVEDARLGDPVRRGVLVRCVAYVDPRLGADSVEYGHGRVLGVRVHQWDGAVQGHGRIGEIFKDVGIVETVWVGVGRTGTGGGRERETRGVLWDAEYVVMVGEIDIQEEGLGA
jgi:hypothetical protein